MMEVSVTGLSEEDEAMFYLRSYWPRVEPVKPEKPLLSQIETKVVRKTRPAAVVKCCFRCGNPDHYADHCGNQIPSEESLRDGARRDLEQVLGILVKELNLVEDEFGYCLPGVRIPADQCFADMDFCHNCGESGHSHQDCLHPGWYETSKYFQQPHFKRGHRYDVRRGFEDFWMRRGQD
jgi:hypothetical protein